MKRSIWASGNAYVPSDSIGFWVAITRNGSGTRWVVSPIVTWCSCITSSSADCTFAGAVDLVREQEVAEHTARGACRRSQSPR